MIDNIEMQSHKPLRELVYDELRSLILKSEIKPMTRLKEVDIAAKMGVSRTPIREAIRKLEIEGLVNLESRRGAYVADMSVKDTIDILDVRSNLEGLAARRAAERMTDEQVIELEKIAEEFVKAVESGDTNLMIKKDEQFHTCIVQSTNNPRLHQVVENLQELVLRFRYMYYSTFKRAEEMPPEHAAICKAIRERDPDTAEKAAYNHIEKLKQMIMQDHS